VRIIFAGTPDIAAVVLEKLLTTEHTIVAVYTQPDRPAGRGQHLLASPVKALALQHHISVEQPISLKSVDVQTQMASYQADLMIVIAYGLILPKAVLAIPKLGCWNVHVSLLPRWRGAAPVQRAIEAGDVETGVCVMQMDAGLDTGDILHRQTCPIFPNQTAGEVHDHLAHLGAEALLHTLQLQQQGKLHPTPQPLEGLTYAHKLTKEEAHLDWNLSAIKIVHKIRAYNPWPVAFTTLNGQVIRLWQAIVVEQRASEKPGTIIADRPAGIDVATGEGVVRITHLQLPSKKAQSATDVLNGHRELFQVGARFL
jgi:methionyl-tRNA formyltransferase